MAERATINLCLISHTNIGKTTLSRTLLKRDVGQVQDREHVTLESAGYVMLQSGSAELVLWDTPGFGGIHAAKIAQRLKGESSPLGWLMSHLVDPLANRSLHSSVEAARAIGKHADVALYLVSAREQPQDAGYIASELEILDLLDVPSIIVLNQVEQDLNDQELSQLAEQWRRHYQQHDNVKHVLVLDAFSRHWMQEISLLESIRSILEDSGDHLDELISAYVDESRGVEEKLAESAAEVITFACAQRIDRENEKSNRQIVSALLGPLQAHFQTFIQTAINMYGLSVENTPNLKAELSAVEGLFREKIPEKEVGFWTAAAAGAGGGIAADLMSGGLTFGSGAILGFVIGGVGGVLAARGLNTLLEGKKECRWSEDFLKGLLHELLFYMLLIAHHGRGKGLVKFDERLDVWNKAISEILDKKHSQVKATISGSGRSQAVTFLYKHILLNLYPRSTT